MADPLPAYGVIGEHANDAAFLWQVRSAAIAEPHYNLTHLLKLDRRITAHVDGLSIAGSLGAALAREVPDEVLGKWFAPTVLALEAGDRGRLEPILAVAEASAGLGKGVISAFGWVTPKQLEGIVKPMMVSVSPFVRHVGLAACELHRVHPTNMTALRDGSALVRHRALRAVGELGDDELTPACIAAIADDDPDCRFWAQWSAVLLGNRGAALEALITTTMTPGPHRERAFSLALQATSTSGAHGVLQGLARESENLRWLLRGSGFAGDSTYVPWLIKHMANDQTARLAGEAFSLITGTDLALLDLEQKPPENFESGPNDDPDDPNVDMDPDDGLPWPDHQKIEKWWAANSSRFQDGQRYFMGAPVVREHCVEVLKNGYQRQRILAAHYLCLLNPGTPLFNTSSPAWRQQKLLAQMK